MILLSLVLIIAIGIILIIAWTGLLTDNICKPKDKTYLNNDEFDYGHNVDSYDHDNDS